MSFTRDIPLQACIHKVPIDPSEHEYQLPVQWPSRLEKPPYWLKAFEAGVYGKAAPKDSVGDCNCWRLLVVQIIFGGRIY
ncbi:putative methyltransferase PMT26 [Bienertia sinuspersici]